MRRYGWEDYDRSYRGRGGGPHYSYDRGYPRGWGMSGLNNAFLYGPRPEERGYDHAIHRGRRGGPRYDAGSFRPRADPWADGPPRWPTWRGGYDRGWY